MKHYFFTIGALLLLITCRPSKPAEESKEITADTLNATIPTETYINYFNVPGPIQYNQEDYLFAWSSRPDSNYYKLQYLRADDVAEKYKQLIILELSFRDLPLKDIVEAKVREIQARKTTDPVATYNMKENKESGEMILDFLLSDHFREENAIAEWNVYRYRTYTDSGGRKGIKVFCFRKHGYGEDSEAFVNDINANRVKYITSFIKLDYPEIKLIE